MAKKVKITDLVLRDAHQSLHADTTVWKDGEEQHLTPVSVF